MSPAAVRIRRGPVLTRGGAEDLATALKAIADPARLQIIDILKGRADLEACVCEFTEPLGLSQPTVSHHLKVLMNAGIVHRERRGSWAWFTLDPKRLDELATAMKI